MKEIKLGLIGLGKRGTSLLRYSITPFCKNIVAVCDTRIERAKNAADVTKEITGKTPICTTDYNEVLANPEVNTVVIATDWEYHVEIAVAAMKAGKAVALEVGGAYRIEDCFELVKTYEETKMPFMFLENGCYCRRELMVLNMVQKGLLGELVHCSGCYRHDLREEVSTGRIKGHYRLRNYLNRNCENYPTHEIGPIAKILNINNGNRFVSLSSTSSKARGLKDYVEKTKTDYEFLKDKSVAQGDIITTVIKCAGGETVVITLDTTLPTYFTRGLTVRGTNGMYEDATDSVFLDKPEDIAHETDWRTACQGNATDYEEEYEHPIWKEYLKNGVEGTHGGVDYLEFKYFFEALENGTPMPIDVYDAATWMAVSALSEQSILKGGAVVDFPDFTCGKWQCPTVE